LNTPLLRRFLSVSAELHPFCREHVVVAHCPAFGACRNDHLHLNRLSQKPGPQTSEKGREEVEPLIVQGSLKLALKREFELSNHSIAPGVRIHL